MALRAGYYGIKRAFRDKLEQIIPAGASKDNQLAMQSEIDGVYATNNLTGAKNFLDPNFILSGASAANITITDNSNGTFTLDGTVAAKASISIKGRNVANKGVYLPIGKYRYSINTDANVYIGTTYNGAYKAISDTKAGSVEFEITADTQSDLKLSDGSVLCAVYMQLLKDVVYNNKVITPMIYSAYDTDNTYVPYVETNKQLTARAADQKNAINAIITAATGAADFAAFKAAMEAITPVTRSAAKIEEVEPEEIEEPVVEKKTTTKKKSTVKAETKEEV